MNYKDVKKQLLKETVLVVVVLGALSGGVWYLGSISDDYERQKSASESQAVALNSQVTSLREKYEKIQKNSDVYNEVVSKSAGDGLNINRQVLRKKFDMLKAQYFLNKAKFIMGAVEELKGAKFKSTSNTVVDSEVSIECEAISDEDVYNFIQSLQQELPGVIRMTEFSITRLNRVTDDALRQIAEKGQYSLVKAELKFVWYGIRTQDSTNPPATPTNSTDTNAPSAPTPAP